MDDGRASLAAFGERLTPPFATLRTSMRLIPIKAWLSSAVRMGCAALGIRLNRPSGSSPRKWLNLDYRVTAERVDGHGSLARTKDATLILDTDVAGRRDAFNPAELFLASIAACMIKGIDRVTPLLKFELRGVEVQLRAQRQDSPPLILRVDYELIVDTDEGDARLDLLHRNVRKFGTISNTVALAIPLDGHVRRRSPAKIPEAQA